VPIPATHPAATRPAGSPARARSIRAVRATPLAALALGLILIALGGPTAQPALAGPSATALAPVRLHPRAHLAAKHGPTVTAALAALLHSSAIPQASYSRYYAAYLATKHSYGRLSGTRKLELGAVLTNLQAIAAAGQFIPTRLPALFLTLERNRQWWTTEPLLSSGERITFPGSKLIWEYYAGQGIEIQWLATFGEGNGYYLSGHENANLRQLVSEVIPLATARAGGIAWEYMFRFDGGLPPWTSGLSQGTGLEVMARAWSRFKEPADLTAAQRAVGIFETAPPQGVMVKTAAGAEYAEYTYAPSDRILNGFIQSLVGLYEYTAITKDPLGLKLFEAGDAEARAEVPHYDTGGWSLYDQFGESNLNYHELLTEFLQHLCERITKGLPYTPAAAVAPAPASPPPTSTTPPTSSTGTGGTGGTTASAAKASAPPPSTPIAGDQVYCTTAQRFSADLKTPPLISLLSTKLPVGTRAGVQISLSKISTVELKVKQGSHVVWSNRATVEHGKPKLLWVTPAKGGTFTVALTATDLAGNFSTTTGTILVSPH
jgi:D-glucuronyl C5-epimerase C-terminus